MLLTFIGLLIIISRAYSITPHSFIPGLNPSFSANPSHCSLPFFFRTDSTDSPRTVYTVTSEHIRFYFLVFLFYTF